jgi:hypothetical protein
VASEGFVSKKWKTVSNGIWGNNIGKRDQAKLASSQWIRKVNRNIFHSGAGSRVITEAECRGIGFDHHSISSGRKIRV